MKTYSSYLADIPRIIMNSDSDNSTWAMEIVNETLRYLTTRYYFNERTYTDTTVSQQQYYNLPPQIKKLINITVHIGGVLWQPLECPSRQKWDYLNVIPTYYQDYPSYYFIYDGQVGLWNIPASSGNTITMNYKTRIIDLSMADVTDASSSQTMSATNASTTITASGSVFLNWMAGQWIRIPFSSSDSTSGDNEWYQIDSITNSTTAVLKNNYTGASVSGAAFTIGQTPLLPEDYQDLPLYRMGIIYYTTRFPDPARAQLYQGLYDRGAAALDEEYGSKSTGIVLNDVDMDMVNPNLYARSLTEN